MRSDNAFERSSCSSESENLIIVHGNQMRIDMDTSNDVLLLLKGAHGERKLKRT